MLMVVQPQTEEVKHVETCAFSCNCSAYANLYFLMWIAGNEFGNGAQHIYRLQHDTILYCIVSCDVMWCIICSGNIHVGMIYMSLYGTWLSTGTYWMWLQIPYLI